MPPVNSTCGAASVTGALHTEEGLPNQDAFLVKSYAFGVVMVVADGVGSKPLSDIGSKAACAAVAEAAHLWATKDRAPVELLIRLIHALWEFRVVPHPKSECGTTCLFAIVLRSGRLVCGQLGDGLIGYELDGNFHVLWDRGENDFVNETRSIHDVKRIGEWTWIDQELSTGEIGIILATDGISEDLIPEKRGDFLRNLQGLIEEKQDIGQRNAVIRKLLLEWPAKHSYDDKTLIVFHRGANKYEHT